MTRKKAKQISEKFAADMAATIDRAPAWFTHATMAEAEKVHQSNGVTRRIALALLIKTGHELIEAVSTDRDFAVALADWSESVDGYLSRLKAERKTVEHANARVLVALAHRIDMGAVLADARAGHDNGAPGVAFT